MEPRQKMFNVVDVDREKKLVRIGDADNPHRVYYTDSDFITALDACGVGSFEFEGKKFTVRLSANGKDYIYRGWGPSGCLGRIPVNPARRSGVVGRPNG